jgi:hypothetical protein
VMRVANLARLGAVGYPQRALVAAPGRPRVWGRGARVRDLGHGAKASHLKPWLGCSEVSPLPRGAGLPWLLLASSCIRIAAESSRVRDAPYALWRD